MSYICEQGELNISYFLPQIEEMKESLESEQFNQREKISELSSDLRRLTSDRDRVAAEMEKVTSRMGECRGMKSKFEKDKKDLKNVLVSMLINHFIPSSLTVMESQAKVCSSVTSFYSDWC